MLTITGEIKVFENKKGFSTSISRVKDLKAETREYDSIWVPVEFVGKESKKGEDLRHGDDVNILNAWLSFRETEKGHKYVTLVVSDYALVKQPPKSKK